LGAQNVNSFNISSNLENWELKVKAVMNTNTNLIFLSDLRLKRKDGFDITNKLRAALLRGSGRKYDLWENSNKKSRGVAILIARDLDFEVLDGAEDQDQNIIALKVRILSKIYVLISIYGPNGCCPHFFANVDAYLNLLMDSNVTGIIIGGDWNTVVDGRAVKENPDLCNMLTFPNHSQNVKLTNLMEKWKLFDAFRVKNPYSLEYSYAPFGTLRNNRSRLDFF
jgi:exonuclease III